MHGIRSISRAAATDRRKRRLDATRTSRPPAARRAAAEGVERRRARSAHRARTTHTQVVRRRRSVPFGQREGVPAEARAGRACLPDAAEQHAGQSPGAGDLGQLAHKNVERCQRVRRPPRAARHQRDRWPGAGRQEAVARVEQQVRRPCRAGRARHARAAGSGVPTTPSAAPVDAAGSRPAAVLAGSTTIPGARARWSPIQRSTRCARAGRRVQQAHGLAGHRRAKLLGVFAREHGDAHRAHQRIAAGATCSLPPAGVFDRVTPSVGAAASAPRAARVATRRDRQRGGSACCGAWSRRPGSSSPLPRRDRKLRSARYPRPGQRLNRGASGSGLAC